MSSTLSTPSKFSDCGLSYWIFKSSVGVDTCVFEWGGCEGEGGEKGEAGEVVGEDSEGEERREGTPDGRKGQEGRGIDRGGRGGEVR